MSAIKRWFRRSGRDSALSESSGSSTANLSSTQAGDWSTSQNQGVPLSPVSSTEKPLSTQPGHWRKLESSGMSTRTEAARRWILNALNVVKYINPNDFKQLDKFDGGEDTAFEKFLSLVSKESGNSDNQQIEKRPGTKKKLKNGEIPVSLLKEHFKRGKVVDKRWVKILVYDKTQAQKLHRVLSKKGWRDIYKFHFTLCYDLRVNKRLMAKWSGSGSDAAVMGQGNGEEASIHDASQPVCGRLALIGSGSSQRLVTIGGMVRKDGALWAVTANHAPTELGDERNEPGEDEEADMDNDLDPDDYDMEDLDPLYLFGAPEPATAPSSQEPAASHPKPEDSLSSQTVATSDDSQTPGPSQTPRMMPISLEFIDSSSLQTGPEWCLIPLDAHPDLCLLPNPETARNIATKPRPGPVIVLAGASGIHVMDMLSSGEPRYLPSGEWFTTWQLRLPDPTAPVPLGKGDSGSWVVSPDNDTVFGLIIGAVGNIVHLVPLDHVLRANQHQPSTKVDQEALPDSKSIAIELAETILQIAYRSIEASQKVNDAVASAQAAAVAVTVPQQPSTAPVMAPSGPRSSIVRQHRLGLAPRPIMRPVPSTDPSKPSLLLPPRLAVTAAGASATVAGTVPRPVYARTAALRERRLAAAV